MAKPRNISLLKRCSPTIYEDRTSTKTIPGDTYDEYSHKASQGGVPVTVGGRFPDQDAVEDKVTQAQFDASC